MVEKRSAQHVCCVCGGKGHALPLGCTKCMHSLHSLQRSRGRLGCLARGGARAAAALGVVHPRLQAAVHAAKEEQLVQEGQRRLEGHGGNIPEGLPHAPHQLLQRRKRHGIQRKHRPVFKQGVQVSVPALHVAHGIEARLGVRARNARGRVVPQGKLTREGPRHHALRQGAHGTDRRVVRAPLGHQARLPRHVLAVLGPQ
mmetsp:Transcript_41107/g.103603  ORF Transcript_41107/g.103603 Transcript_41107/m.103603 type:complete len:200 (-) Transcript_41107:601-1200(-)